MENHRLVYNIGCGPLGAEREHAHVRESRAPLRMAFAWRLLTDIASEHALH